MPGLDGLKVILVKLLGYPLRETLDDISDIKSDRKVMRNIWRLIIGSGSAVTGGLLPYQISSTYGNWLQGLITSLIGNGVSETLAESTQFTAALTVILSTWAIWTGGLYCAKKTAQVFYRFKAGDSNSDHILTDSDLDDMVNKFEELLQDENPGLMFEKEVLRKQLREAHRYLVRKIRDGKNQEENPRFRRYMVVPDPHDKQYYKALYWNLKEGNIKPFNDYCNFAPKFQRLKIEALNRELETLAKNGEVEGEVEFEIEVERAKEMMGVKDGKRREGKGVKDAKDGKEDKEGKLKQERKDGMKGKESKEGKEVREAREVREVREDKKGREGGEGREGKAGRESLEDRETRRISTVRKASASPESDKHSSVVFWDDSPEEGFTRITVHNPGEGSSGQRHSGVEQEFEQGDRKGDRREHNGENEREDRGENDEHRVNEDHTKIKGAKEEKGGKEGKGDGDKQVKEGEEEEERNERNAGMERKEGKELKEIRSDSLAHLSMVSPTVLHNLRRLAQDRNKGSKTPGQKGRRISSMDMKALSENLRIEKQREEQGLQDLPQQIRGLK